MVYLSPLAGLGQSPMAKRFAIRDLEEAKRFLADPILGDRLRQAIRLMFSQKEKSALEILGSPDDLKFCSCLTLFRQAAAEQGDRALLMAALDQFYGGEPDRQTLALLSRGRGQSDRGRARLLCQHDADTDRTQRPLLLHLQWYSNAIVANSSNLDIATVQQQALANGFRFHISQYLSRRAEDWKAKGFTETLTDWTTLNARSKFWGDDQRAAFRNWEDITDMRNPLGQRQDVNERIMLRELLRRVDMMVIFENHLDALVRLHTPWPPALIGGAYQYDIASNLRPESFNGPNAD